MKLSTFIHLVCEEIHKDIEYFELDLGISNEGTVDDASKNRIKFSIGIKRGRKDE